MAILSPDLIYREIEKTVIGQHEAKRTVSIALFIHYVRIFQNLRDNMSINKSNMLIHGPSGNGKTLLIREGCEAVKTLTRYPAILPMLEVDCTTLTSSGWQGNNIDDLIGDHYENYFGDFEPLFPKSSVIFLDEIDKLCMPAVGSGGTDFNKMTQYNLLKAVEGTRFKNSARHVVDTTEMLFVFAGNFPQIRKARDAAKKGVGFQYNHATNVSPDQQLALQKAGMTTQLAGRISYVAELERLDRKDLTRVLKELIVPEKIDTWNYLDYDFKLSDYRVKLIVEEALDKKTGARGLLSAIDRHLEDEIFFMEFES